MKQTSLFQKLFLIGLILFFVLGFIGQAQDARKRHQGALAIVRIAGPIQGDMSTSAWSTSSAEDIARDLHKYSEDNDIKAIVLRINSPGGTVGAVQEIDKEIARCRAKGKKIVASMGDVAASGGYYLAAASDRIVANPGTITGSIGVILQFGDLEKLFQKVGLQLQVIKSGIHKDIGSPARALTPEEKRLLQDSIDDAYAQFFEAVRTGRHMAPEKLKALADGRIFTGRQAQQAGLVDELGNQEDAIQAAILLAKLPAKPYLVTSRKKSLASFLEKATSEFSRQPMESLQDLIGTGMEYRWRP